MAESGGNEAVVGCLLRALTAGGLLVSVILVFVRWPTPDAPPAPDAVSVPAGESLNPSVVIPAIPFSDQTVQAGIDFVHVSGATREKLLPETMSGGGGFFDFDRDGDPDLLCVSGTHWPWSTADPGETQVLTLFENDGTGQFRNITAGSGLDVSGIYGNGVACGDYDNDGAVDIYLTALGTNRLFRNLGGGQFEDVTQAAGVAGEETAWSTSAGWLDYDADGDLDLFVCHYLSWSVEADRTLQVTLTGTLRGYARPTDFPGAHPVLYRNDGAGRFTDVSADVGIRQTDPVTGQPLSKSLGVTFADVNNDLRPDVLVANDTVPNQLFLNRADEPWEEVAARCGIAFDNDGRARGAMGIAAARFRNTEALGVAIGNFANETTALYVDQLPEQDLPLFRDEAVPSGLGSVTRAALTFGTLFCDVDLDGRLDLVTCNGHLEEEIAKVQNSQQYAQPPQLFWNAGPLSSAELIAADEQAVGREFLRPMVGRGATQADIDGDGDPDLLLFSLNGPPRLLRNEQQTGHHWLKVRLHGRSCSRDAIGARVLLIREDGRVLQRTVMPTCSYQSQVELPVTFGLGKFTSVKYLKVIWPDGEEQTVSVSSVDQATDVVQESR